METLRVITLILGYAWLLIVGGMVLSQLAGSGSSEDISQVLIMGLFLALPGCILVLIARRKP